MKKKIGPHVLLLSLSLTGCFASCTLGESDGESGGGSSEGGSSEGGSAGSGGDGASGEGGAAAPPHVLWVLNETAGIQAYEAPEAQPESSATPEVDLPTGADTELYGPRDFILSEQSELWVANENGPSITVYDVSDRTSVGLAPVRTLSGTNTHLEAPISLARTTDDTLYVVNNLSNGALTRSVLAFEEASTLSGDVAPTRLVDVDVEGFAPLSIHYRDGDLWAVHQTLDAKVALIRVNDIDAASGAVSPASVLTDDAWGQVLSVHFGADGALYAVGEGTELWIYDAIADQSGELEANRTITVETASAMSGAVLLDGGAMFLADRSIPAIHHLDAELLADSGNVDPSRTFTGASVRLPSKLVWAR